MFDLNIKMKSFLIPVNNKYIALVGFYVKGVKLIILELNLRDSCAASLSIYIYILDQTYNHLDLEYLTILLLVYKWLFLLKESVIIAHIKIQYILST